MRRPRVIGKQRKVLLRDLQVGMQIVEPIRGYAGKVLVCDGEILTRKHLEQLAKWDARDGVGKLSLYTRAVYAQATDASGDERPACETNPYEAHSVQRLWKKSMGYAVRPIKGETIGRIA